MTARPWSPEREIPPELAAKLIEAQFPELAPARVEFLAAGWDNTVFLVGGAWVFRFPRRAIAVPLIEREGRLLPAIGSRVPVPVPQPKCLGRPSADYPWPFAGYPFLPGRPAAGALLSDAARDRLAAPLGLFVRALHSFPVAEAERLGAIGDELGRADVLKRTPKARDAIIELGEKGALDSGFAIERLEELAVVPPAPRPRVLVHGDLYARNLLVDDQGALAAVIDWGDLHLGDPANDLMLAFSLLGPSARLRFRAACGEVSDETWRLARFRALDHTLAVVRYALEAGDPAFEQDVCASLARVLATD